MFGHFTVVVQLLSCVWFCDTMDYNTPGFPVLHISWSLLKLMSIGSMIPSNHLILCRPLFLLESFPASGSFHMSQFFASGGQSIGASASASVLPMNIQGWFPLGLSCLISLLRKGLPRVFSSTTVGKHQFLDTQPSFWFSSHNHTWLLEKTIALTKWTFFWPSNVSAF